MKKMIALAHDAGLPRTRRGYAETGTTPPNFLVISRAVRATSGPSFRMRSSVKRAIGPASEIAPSGSRPISVWTR